MWLCLDVCLFIALLILTASFSSGSPPPLSCVCLGGGPMDFLKNWYTSAKNCFSLTALFSSYLHSVLHNVIQVLKKKNGKNCWKNSIGRFTTLVVSMVISLLLKTVGLIKIGALSSKFCLFSGGVIIFLVSLILFK